MSTDPALPPAQEPDPYPDLPPPSFQTCVLILAIANDYIDLLEKVTNLLGG
jgi:hypothetical protein